MVPKFSDEQSLQLLIRHLPLNKIPAVVEGLLVFRRDIGLTAGILFLGAPLISIAVYLLVPGTRGLFYEVLHMLQEYLVLVNAVEYDLSKF